MRGKAWTTKEEKHLRDMLQEGKRITEIAAAYGKSPSAVTQKMRRLGLEVVVRQNRHTTTPKDLPSVQEALEKLRDAIFALEVPGLEQSETLRLRSIIHGVKLYIEKFGVFELPGTGAAPHRIGGKICRRRQRFAVSSFLNIRGYVTPVKAMYTLLRPRKLPPSRKSPRII